MKKEDVRLRGASGRFSAALPQASSRSGLWKGRHIAIAALAAAGIACHLVLRFALKSDFSPLPLLVVLFVGGSVLVAELAGKIRRKEYGSDLLAGISIVTALLLKEYLAGAVIVLMLSGGQSLEAYAVHHASSVLSLLAKRMPDQVHFRKDGRIVEGRLEEVATGDLLVVFPHEACPADALVIEGRGTMNEAYLTGEPFLIDKVPGSSVVSGAINGDRVLVVRAVRRPGDSRYAKILAVMEESSRNRPRIRRLGDRLGAAYTPVAVGVALLAWAFSGEPTRFLSVLVVATPCPLLIGIPVALIGSVSLSARRGVIVRDASVFERTERCRTAIFDKTGTLTYGLPHLEEIVPAPGFEKDEVLRFAAALERYSRHPLASAILGASQERGWTLWEVSEASEAPGAGLRGTVLGRTVWITGRGKLGDRISGRDLLPPVAGGLECVVVLDGRYAGLLRFRDAPRTESRRFVGHLGPRHQFSKLIILSGDREEEVRRLAGEVGIDEVHAEKTPEEKLAIVRRETERTGTLYVGDGVNDAPAMMAATVGVAVGRNSDVAAEAAAAVVLDGSLERVDEFLHIGRRTLRIAVQTAVGGMTLSLAGMAFAVGGYLNPVEGAIFQEVIDVLAIFNALRTVAKPRFVSDC